MKSSFQSCPFALFSWIYILKAFLNPKISWLNILVFPLLFCDLLYFSVELLTQFTQSIPLLKKRPTSMFRLSYSFRPSIYFPFLLYSSWICLTFLLIIPQLIQISRIYIVACRFSFLFFSLTPDPNVFFTKCSLLLNAITVPLINFGDFIN